MSEEVYHLSEEGLAQLKQELVERENVLRKDIAEKIGTAKEQGDLSENFEYQDAKERQAQNETRIIQLRDMISRAQIIEKAQGSDEIGLGSEFTATLQDGTEKTFEMVGPTETDPLSGKISNESPIGKAFVGKSVGDTVEIEVPSGTMTYTVTHIE